MYYMDYILLIVMCICTILMLVYGIMGDRLMAVICIELFIVIPSVAYFVLDMYEDKLEL